MADPQAGEALAQVWRGHALLLACAALYLTWWAVFFRPGAGQVTGALYGFGALCLVGAAVCGSAGAFWAAGALGRLPGAAAVPGWAFGFGAVAAYLVLLAVTRGIFGRQVTTELVLICAWGAFELCVCAALCAAGAIGPTAATGLAVAVVLLVAGSLVCYVLYYRLGPVASFWDGAVPLAAVGAEAAAVMALIGA